MTEQSEFEQFKQVINYFTSKGCLSFKKLFNFVFPSQEEIPVDNFGSKWRKRISYGAPLVATLILLGIFYVGYLWGKKYEMGLIMFGLHFLICSVGVVYVGALFLFSFIVKLKKRSPAVLLGLTVVFPFRALIFLCVINPIFFVFIANSGNSSHTKKIKKHISHYERLSLSDEISVDEGPENILAESKKVSSEVKKSTDRGNVEKLFQQFSEKNKEEMKQVQENFFRSVTATKQENAKKKVNFGKHCILLGKIGEHNQISEEVFVAQEEEGVVERPLEVNLPLFFGWDKAPYNRVQEITENPIDTK